jgi:mRNA interferase MazF
LLLGVPGADEDRSLVTAVPHTTSVRGTRFEVSVSPRFLKVGAFDAQGLVTIPTVRLMRRLGMLSPQELDDVVRGVCLWLDIKCEF